jgi:hypothetical protein
MRRLRGMLKVFYIETRFFLEIIIKLEYKIKVHNDNETKKIFSIFGNKNL